MKAHGFQNRTMRDRQVFIKRKHNAAMCAWTAYQQRGWSMKRVYVRVSSKVVSYRDEKVLPLDARWR